MKKFCVLLLTVLMLSGCTQTTKLPDSFSVQPKKKINQIEALRVQLNNNINTIDPAFCQSKEERQIADLLFEGLVRLDQDTMKPQKALAKKIDISPDGKVYTFTLDTKARFSNQAPIKASDVKFSWERAIYLNSPEKYIFTNIFGYWDFITGRTQDMLGIKVIDDKTLQVTLAASDKDFLLSITSPAAAVVDRYQVIKLGNIFGKPGNLTSPPVIPNSSGRYKLYEWIANDHVTVGNNLYYHLAKPKVERIVINFQSDKASSINDYLLNNLDSIMNVTEDDLAVEQGLNGRLQSIPVAEISFLRIKPYPTNRALSDIRVRKALMLATDFKRIGLYSNTESYQYLTGSITDYLQTGVSTDLNTSVIYNTYQSAKLLEQAGYPQGKGLYLTLYYLNEPQLKNAAELIKGEWGARGIHISIQPLSQNQLNNLKNTKDALIYLDKWSAPYPSVAAFFYPQFHTAFPLGISSAIDTQIADALFTSDTALRTSKFRQLEKNLRELYLIQPIYKTNISVLTKPWIEQLTGNRLGLLTLDKVVIKQE